MNGKTIKNILWWGIDVATYALSIYAIYYVMVRYLNIPPEDSSVFIAFIFIPMTGVLIYILYKGYKSSGGREYVSLDFLVEDISSPKYVKIMFWLISPIIVSILAYLYYFMASFLLIFFMSLIQNKALNGKLTEHVFTLIGLMVFIFSIITYYYMWRIYSNKSNKDKLR